VEGVLIDVQGERGIGKILGFEGSRMQGFE